jgi:hypothetical protein
MNAPRIRSISPPPSSLDDEAAHRWSELRQALGEHCWPAHDRPAPPPIDDDHLHEAARRALERYPGPVGLLIRREILAYLEFGHRFARASLITRLVEDLLEQEPRPQDIP